MEYQAIAKYIRMSPRKVRLVAHAIKRLTPTMALLRLRELPKRASGPLVDVVASAIANVKDKKADVTKMRFKSIEVSYGPVMKRIRAVSKGQAHAYKKRMTHIRVVLTDEGVK